MHMRRHGVGPRPGGGGWRLAAALLCALSAVVAVAVWSPGRPAGAASDQSGGSQPPSTSAAPSTSASVDPPGAPSGLDAALYAGSVVLGWDNPGDVAITKYQYQIRDVDAGGDYGKTWTDIPGSGASTVTYSIPVTGSGRRNVRLRAVNSGGSGGYAVATTDAPAAPLRFRASLGGGSVSLSWDDPGDDSVGKYQYRIKTAGVGNAWSLWADVADSGASTVSATISGVTGSERRVVELQARPVSRLGWGATYHSAWASTGPPAKPSGFNIPGGSYVGGDLPVVVAPASSPKGEADLHWSDPGDESIVKYQYKIRPARSGTIDSQWIDIPGSGASTTSHTFVFPTPEMYSIRLRSINSAGATAARPVNVKSFWPALAAPSGLKASLSGSSVSLISSVSLSWDNPYDGSIHKYQYRIKTVGTSSTWSNWADIPNSDGSTTSYRIRNVTGSERRVVQLRATRLSLGGTGSPASASTGPPAQPSGLNIPGGWRTVSSLWGPQVGAPASSPKGEVDLHWSDPGDESIVKYQYRIRQTGTEGTNNSQWIDIPGSGASTTNYKFVVPTDREYRLGLRAVNNAGAAFKKFTVWPSWTAPAAPSGLKASLSGNTVSLSWDNPFADGSIYEYQYRIKTVGVGNAWSEWADIVPTGDDNAPTFTATITVTGSGQRNVQLRVKYGNNPAATASTG